MRGTWTGKRAVAIAVGGALGAVARWATLHTFTAGTFPWPVIALNVVGSVVLGVLLAEETTHPRTRLVLHDAGAIGFCGGLTTFSTFAVDVAELLRDDEVTSAALYLVTSVAVAVAGVMLGAAALHRVRAAALPLEERP